MTRELYISEKFRKYLMRRITPDALGSKELADIELNALVGVILRFAPSTIFDQWYSLFEQILGESMKHRYWPTEGEIAEAARSVRFTPTEYEKRSFSEFDPLGIAQKKMNRGDPVSDYYIFGGGADLLQSRGMVPRETIIAYRMGIYKKFEAAYRDGALDQISHIYGDVAKETIIRNL